MDLIALGKFVLQVDDDLNTATVLKSPFVGMNEDTLFDLAYGRTGSIWQALASKAQTDASCASARSWLLPLLGLADQVTPFEFFSHILVQKQGRTLLAARLGEDIHDPVSEFLAAALAFEGKGAVALQAFLHDMENSASELKRDMEAQGDKVRIMTVHSAKGLQAPIVFLPDTVSMPNTGKEGRVLLFGEQGNARVPMWVTPGEGLDSVEMRKDTLKMQQLFEYRRLLYVALTRAEDHLYVMGWKGPKDTSPDCWYSLIKDGITRLGIGPGTDDVYRYEIAHTLPVDPDGGHALQGDMQQMGTSLPAWLMREKPAEPDPPRPLTPSKPEGEDIAVLSPLKREKDTRFHRGTLIHAILEWVPDLPESKRLQAIADYVRLHGRGLSKQQQAAILPEIQAVLENPDFSSVFGLDSRAEVPIVAVLNGRVLSGQVDRLVWTENEILIVDYKTNQPPPVDVAAIPHQYLVQMGLYVRALRQIYPRHTVRAALLWTYTCTLVQVPENLMNQALDG